MIVDIFFLVLLLQAPLEIIVELCRDLRRDRKMKHLVNADESEVVVRMESAKVLVISHDISLITAISRCGS